MVTFQCRSYKPRGVDERDLRVCARVMCFTFPFSLSLFLLSLGHSLFFFPQQSQQYFLRATMATGWLHNLTYDIALWIFILVLEIFFREIRPRGAHRVPKQGPVIFVVAPHANQVSSLNHPMHTLPSFLPQLIDAWCNVVCGSHYIDA